MGEKRIELKKSPMLQKVSRIPGQEMRKEKGDGQTGNYTQTLPDWNWYTPQSGTSKVELLYLSCD